MRELYASRNDVRVKGREWLELLERHEKRRANFELDASRSALIIIDMQGFFLDEGSHAFLPSAVAIVPNVKKLLGVYRKMGHLVVFTRHAYEKGEDPGIMARWWADNIMEGTPSSRIASSLKPKKSEIVLRKTRYSAFQRTDLESLLNERNIKSVVITGVMTHLCCESTAREAFMRDFEVYFVVDATATQYEEFHIASLRTLSDGFAIPVTTDEVLSNIGGQEVE